MLGRLYGLAGVRPVLGAMFVVIAVMAPTAVAGQDFAEDPAAACSRPHLKDVAKVGQFIFKSYKSEDDGACLQVIRDGKLIFRRTVDSREGYTLGQPGDQKSKIPAIANGTDITGRGHPDMIVSFYTGGAHCCTLHYVFELEPKFKLLATLDARDTWPAYFADLDRNQQYYYLAEDWTFAYWPGNFVSSPNAPIVLQFVEDAKGGKYHLALDKMKKPAPTQREWKDSLHDISQGLIEYGDTETTLAATLWNAVLKLIYSGDSDLAWRFLDEGWPKSREGKEDAFEYFCGTLKTSPYWPDLEPTLKNTPPACANAKPRR
jgi:hypothetical protein